MDPNTILLTNPDFLMWMLLSNITIIGIPTVSYFLWKARRHELDVGLKHDMLARGMSVDDIVKVLSSSSAKSKAGVADQPDSVLTQPWGGKSS